MQKQKRSQQLRLIGKLNSIESSDMSESGDYVEFSNKLLTTSNSLITTKNEKQKIQDMNLFLLQNENFCKMSDQIYRFIDEIIQMMLANSTENVSYILYYPNINY